MNLLLDAVAVVSVPEQTQCRLVSFKCNDHQIWRCWGESSGLHELCHCVTFLLQITGKTAKYSVALIVLGTFRLLVCGCQAWRWN